ncbi:MAG: 23S rRNA (adenine(2503)-C(2))-methyltransferase RlmN [Magnetococcales bacterium]|nr:23S rRNA (adenine(2503)-C(2))-methyltransferase RlmN [Magnetococcales bacterium]
MTSLPKDDQRASVSSQTDIISADDRIQLIGLTRSEMEDLFVSWGEKPFRARQIWSWLHAKLVDDVDAMTDIAKLFRARLKTLCAPFTLTESAHLISKDGTQKWLMALDDGQEIETVFIPDEERGTLCVSSQVGCTLNCPFCYTGAQGFARNLTTAEIVAQVRQARATLHKQQKRITNLVLMGMGEPLYNYDNVIRAIKIFNDDAGLAFGLRKITLSTAGVVPRMLQAGRAVGVNLAVSLHSVNDRVRDQLVPINRKYNLAALQKAAKAYPLRGKKRITWEYVMLDGVNDSLADAKAFAQWMRGIPSKVNLIPFNPWPGTPYTPSDRAQIERFQEVLRHAGYVTVIRDSRGDDIEAACGQLKGALRNVRPRKIAQNC